jgi:hypothetical protein
VVNLDVGNPRIPSLCIWKNFDKRKSVKLALDIEKYNRNIEVSKLTRRKQDANETDPTTDVVDEFGEM